MRLFDAHVHIRPAHLLGAENKRFGTKLTPYGKLLLPDGGVYQCMPPYFADSCFSADTLLATMDTYGVQRAMILQSISMQLNDDIAAAVARYPDRLHGAMLLEPRDESVLDDLAALHQRGLRAIKFEMSEGVGFSHPAAYPAMRFDDALMGALFDAAQQRGMTVAIDPSRIFDKGYQVEAIEQAVKSHPALRFVLCHLGFPEPGLRGNRERYARWQAMTALARYDNVWFDISAQPDLFLAQGWPFPGALELLREFLDHWGAAKPVWGTDIPGTLSAATYPQMIGMFADCALFSDEEKERMFWHNAQAAYL